MSGRGKGKGLPRGTDSGAREPLPFLGFTSLDANFLYCPNQFLDICLPNHSRGCVRLVSYLFRKTLGWRDEFGRPLQQRIPVPYQQLIDHAGISRGAIRDAIDEAVKARFIRCTLEGHANSNGKAAQSSSYELRWDTGAEYARASTEFQGFFAGDGHRTPIPNDFFDVVVPNESLAVIRVVGAVIRKTIGYQDQFGGRRSAAPLSFTELQRRSNIADRKTISQAIRHSMEHNYVVLVREGRFDPNGGERNQAAAYGIRWAPEAATSDANSSKTPPASKRLTVQKPHRPQDPVYRAVSADDSAVDGSKILPVARGGNGSKTPPAPSTVQKPHRGRSNNPTGNGSKTPLLERVLTKSTSKEQQQTAAADGAFEALRKAGFDAKASALLARHCSVEQVLRQLEWLPRRTVTRNPMGLLRQALLEDWPEPKAALLPDTESPALLFARGFYAGIAGNKGRAVADPSANDVATAERFMKRVGAALEGDMEASGRSFGGLVREWRGTAVAGSNSLVTALRSFGDKYFSRLEGQVESARRARNNREAETRVAQQKADYQTFLSTFEQVLKSSRVADYKHFEAWRAKERERVGRSSIGAKHLLAHHDSDAKRLEDLQSFFTNDIPSFAAWLKGRQSADEVTVPA